MAIFPNYSETHVCSLLWQKKLGELFFGKKQPVIAERQTFFSKTLKLSQVFAQLSLSEPVNH